MHREIGVALLRHGYDALAKLREESGGAPWFEARMLGRRALVVRGEDGVRTFYVPALVRLLLFGRGAVHGLAGEAHRERKQLYLDVVDRTWAARLAEEVDGRLHQAMARWPGRDSVRVFDELTA